MNNSTHIIVVLDKSGSMNSIYGETVNGFNEFIKDQKETGEDAIVTLAQFSSNNHFAVNNSSEEGWYLKTYDGKSIDEVPELNKRNYYPSGGTALYDAIGKTVHEAENMDQPEKVILLVITDGQENSSRMYLDRHIHAILKRKQKEGWECVFIGADQDAIQAGSRMGISAGNTMSFSTRERGGTIKMFRDVSRKTTAWRTSTSKEEFFAQ